MCCFSTSNCTTTRLAAWVRQDPLRKLPDLLARLRERDIKEKEEVRREKVEGKRVKEKKGERKRGESLNRHCKR